MRQLLAPLLLLFCQPQAQQPEEQVDPPEVQPVAPPRLQIEEESWTTYRKALHLIDVRGKYEEGADLLLELSGAEDVLRVAGQSSLILSNAARGYALAGEIQKSTALLHGIRNESRGSNFEQAVQELVSGIGPTGFGLDPGFMEHILTRLEVQYGARGLARQYGRDLLPYLRYLADDPYEDNSFSRRSKAARLAIRLLDQSSSTWLEGHLTSGSHWAKTFLYAIPQDRFHDLEARTAALEAMSNALQHMSGDLHDRLFLVAVRMLAWPDEKGEFPESPDYAAFQESLLAEISAGKLQNYEEISAFAIGLSGSSEPHLSSFLSRYSYLIPEEHRSRFRTKVSHYNPNYPYLRDWAMDGSTEDEIRFLLSVSPFHKQLMRGAGDSGYPKWASTHLAALGFSEEDSNYIHTPGSKEGDQPVILSLAGSEDPLVKFLVAIWALQSNDRGFSLDMVLQEDPHEKWVEYFFEIWNIQWHGNNFLNVHPESLPKLRQLSQSAWGAKLARSLLNETGEDVLDRHIWEEFSLSPSSRVASRMYSRARSAEDPLELLWIASQGFREGEDNSSVPALHSLASMSPLVFLDHYQEIPEATIQATRGMSLVDAWSRLLSEYGPSTLEEYREDFYQGIRRDLPLDRLDNVWIQALNLNQDLSLQAALPLFVESPSRARALFPEVVQTRIRFTEGDSELCSEFILEILKAGFSDIVEQDESLLVDGMVLSSDHAVEAFHILWEANTWSLRFHDTVIQLTVKDPRLRQVFREELIQTLKQEKAAIYFSAACRKEGVVEEFLDAFLEAAEQNAHRTALVAILTALPTVDDPRVIETLLRQTEDPRQDIAGIAASGLSMIRSRRSQRSAWQSWSVDELQVDPVVVLLNNLKDPSLEIRIVSIQSLGTLGDLRALPVLVELLRDSSPEIKQAARLALAKINAAPQAETETPEEQ